MTPEDVGPREVTPDCLWSMTTDDLWAVLGALQEKKNEAVAQVEAVYTRPMDLVQREIDSRVMPRPRLRRIR